VVLRNTSQRAREVRVEAEIVGITDKSARTVTLPVGAGDTVRIVPPLKAELDLSSVRGERPSTLSFRVIEALPSGDRQLWEETQAVTLLSRDMLPLSRKMATDAYKPTREFAAAWVTPNAKAIDAFLQRAKARAPRETFAGEQMPTIPQVWAIWDELKARGVSYVMDPETLSDLGAVQRTRLPSEVLASTNAQCLESTILFATLLEAIGLRPLIVYVPGHAFVGWHTVEESGLAGDSIVYLETTMVHDAPFTEAVKTAMERVREEEAAGNFAHGVSLRFELTELRARGIKPQPVE
jgi:hypothetical protein